MKKVCLRLHRAAFILISIIIFGTVTFGSVAVAAETGTVVKFETGKGDITLQLYPDEAPLTVANFLYYVANGFYDGADNNGATVFHRVVHNFVIQGGGFNTNFYENPYSGYKTTLDSILNEADNGLNNEQYTIAMARSESPHSATSQFFINVADNPNLNYTSQDNWGYAVFGRVTEGQETVDAIHGMETTDETYLPFKNVPVAPVILTKAVIVGMEDLSAFDNNLYFPHIAANSNWETEICVINTSDTQELKGILRAFNQDGEAISGVVAVSLPANGRKELAVGDVFPNADQVSHIVLNSDSGTACGYTKFFVENRYRVALPAVTEANTDDIYISHIASDPQWWTGVSLLNTGASDAELRIEFNNGEVRTITLPSQGHQAFTIRSLFGNEPQEAIQSAVIKDAEGVIGLELFGSTEDSGNNYLSGILLKEDTASDLYYPHIASDTDWWTGIVAYNPSDAACMLRIKPIADNGTALASQTISLPSHEKYIGTIQDLNLPGSTAWLELEATVENTDTLCPVTGFELFGKRSGQQLGGYGVVAIDTTTGVFPKLEKTGWTGIAMVNPKFSRANVVLTAYNDNGETLATEEISLNSRSKRVDLAEDLFQQDIAGATYIRYTSTREIVAFQLNGSDDDMLLDGLPGMLTE